MLRVLVRILKLPPRLTGSFLMNLLISLLVNHELSPLFMELLNIIPVLRLIGSFMVIALPGLGLLLALAIIILGLR